MASNDTPSQLFVMDTPLSDATTEDIRATQPLLHPTTQESLPLASVSASYARLPSIASQKHTPAATSDPSCGLALMTHRTMLLMDRFQNSMRTHLHDCRNMLKETLEHRDGQVRQALVAMEHRMMQRLETWSPAAETPGKHLVSVQVQTDHVDQAVSVEVADVPAKPAKKRKVARKTKKKEGTRASRVVPFSDALESDKPPDDQEVSEVPPIPSASEQVQVPQLQPVVTAALVTPKSPHKIPTSNNTDALSAPTALASKPDKRRRLIDLAQINLDDLMVEAQDESCANAFLISRLKSKK